MTYVVTESCIKCKYTDCVDVCPADCFYEGPNFLAIDPEECIDCALCVNECPVEAIYHEDDLEEDQKVFLKLNELLASAKSFGVIIESKPAPENADDYAAEDNKINLLEFTQEPEDQAIFEQAKELVNEIAASKNS